MIAIDDVKHWLVDGDNKTGIGHVVFGVQNGWTLLGCGARLGGCLKEECETEKPKRICRKCRESLKTATVVKNGESSNS